MSGNATPISSYRAINASSSATSEVLLERKTKEGLASNSSSTISSASSAENTTSASTFNPANFSIDEILGDLYGDAPLSLTSSSSSSAAAVSVTTNYASKFPALFKFARKDQEFMSNDLCRNLVFSRFDLKKLLINNTLEAEVHGQAVLASLAAGLDTEYPARKIKGASLKPKPNSVPEFTEQRKEEIGTAVTKFAGDYWHVHYDDDLKKLFDDQAVDRKGYKAEVDALLDTLYKQHNNINSLEERALEILRPAIDAVPALNPDDRETLELTKAYLIYKIGYMVEEFARKLKNNS